MQVEIDSLPSRFGARDLLPFFINCPFLSKLSLENCEIKLSEFVLLVELLESATISPSLQCLHLEPARISLMNIEESANWGSAFKSLETVIRKHCQEHSSRFELSQELCSCGGLLPTNPYTLCPGQSEKNCSFWYVILSNECIAMMLFRSFVTTVKRSVTSPLARMLGALQTDATNAVKNATDVKVAHAWSIRFASSVVSALRFATGLELIDQTGIKVSQLTV